MIMDEVSANPTEHSFIRSSMHSFLFFVYVGADGHGADWKDVGI